MTTGPVTLIHQWLDAVDAGDIDGFSKYLHQDMKLHVGGVTHDGLDAVKKISWPILEAFPDVKHTIREVVREGNTLAAHVVFTATHQGRWLGTPATGNALRFDQALLAHARDGKIAEIWEVVDSATMMQQIGVRPSG